MKNFLNQLYYKLNRFMLGRNRNDELNFTLLVILMLLTIIFRFTAFYRYASFIILPLLFIIIFRGLSKNLAARRYENKLFLRLVNKVDRVVRPGRYQDKIFSCPQCKQRIRIPKQRGRIEISCPRCHCKFIKKT